VSEQNRLEKGKSMADLSDFDNLHPALDTRVLKEYNDSMQKMTEHLQGVAESMRLDTERMRAAVGPDAKALSDILSEQSFAFPGTRTLDSLRIDSLRDLEVAAMKMPEVVPLSEQLEGTTKQLCNAFAEVMEQATQRTEVASQKIAAQVSGLSESSSRLEASGRRLEIATWIILAASVVMVIDVVIRVFRHIS